MQTYEIIVSGRAVHANSADTTLVRTSIGIDKIHVLFDNTEWTAFPVRVTFANGDTIISTSLTLTEIDAPEWAAEAECAIPWEVIQDLGGIRITFQGTDASGNHIITEASGTPLTVVEAGDVGSGTVPSPAPSVDEWNQAYANAMAAANLANGAAESADEAAALATEAAQQAAQAVPIATTETVGKVKPDGTTVTIDNDGTIHSVGGYELPTMGVNTKGGAKVGNGLTVSNDTLSANVTGIKGNAEDSYRTGNVNLTPANLGAATQTDLAAAEQNISDLQDAVGDVDVSTDGSLQEQINDLGESVSKFKTLTTTGTTSTSGNVRLGTLKTTECFVLSAFCPDTDSYVVAPYRFMSDDGWGAHVTRDSTGEKIASTTITLKVMYAEL